MSASAAEAQPASDFLRVMRERGYIHQLSDEAGIDALARGGQLNTYVGYDCTGLSLHVGHLLSIMMLHWLQELSLIHISEPTRQEAISYAVFCLKKKKNMY